MAGENPFTESDMNAEDITRFNDSGLVVGAKLIYKSEMCKVREVNPYVFDRYSDVSPEDQAAWDAE